jgi:hypothetical protein
MVLILGDRDIRQCMNMSEAIAAIESMCRDQAEGKALLAGRVNLALPNGWIRCWGTRNFISRVSLMQASQQRTFGMRTTCLIIAAVNC